MSTPTTTTAKVSASVMDQYNRAQAGEAPSAIAKALGIKAATVSANVKRVAAHVEAGHTLEVEGDAGTITLTPGTQAVDPHEVAEGMVEGASIVTREVAKVEAEGEALRNRATTLRAQADAIEAQAEAVVTKGMPRIEAVAKALGFDIAAWQAAVIEAEAKATDPGEDAGEAKAKA